MEEQGGGSGGLSFEQLLKRLQECYDPDIDSKLINIYIAGSRVYGTAREDSDWDYVAVTSVPTSRKIFPEKEANKEGEGGGEGEWHPDLPFPPSMNLDVYEDTEMNFDMSFMTVEHFTILLREHRMAVLEVIYVPKPFLVLERHKFTFEIDPDVLRKSISWSASLKFDIGKRRLGEGRVLKTKKLIWLSYRYYIFAMQLLEKGEIYDYHAANVYWADVLNSEAATWEEFEEKFKPRLKELEAKFKAMRAFNDFYTKDEIETTMWPEFKKHPRENKKKNPATKTTAASTDEHPFETVNFLRAKGLEALVKEYRILTCRHIKYPNLVQLSHSAFSPKRESKIVRECNGLIVDEDADFNVVAAPYEKFFDWILVKDSLPIDTKDFILYEKLDGLLCTLYYYDNEWHLASQRIPDANDPVCFKSLTGDVGPKAYLYEKFWNLWKEKGYSLPKDTTMCYMFELLCPDFRKIAYNEQPRIVLHGARRMSDMKEVLPHPIAEANGWECVKSFADLNSQWEKALDAKETLNPFSLPGYVVCDSNFNRVKLVSAQYVAVSSALGFQNTGFGPFNLGAENFDWECLIEQIRINKVDQFLSYFPKWEERVIKAKAQYDAFIASIDKQYAPLRGVTDQKDVAKMIGTLSGVDKTVKAMFFEIKKEDVDTDLRDYFARQGKLKVLKLLKTFLEKEAGGGGGRGRGRGKKY